MVFPIFVRLLAIAAVAGRLVAGAQTIGLCRDKVCGDCPENIDLQPDDEYPFCGHWNATTLMANYTDFPVWDKGGLAPFLSIGQPEDGCQTIIRTPTSTDVPGCGIPLAAFHNAICFQLPLQGLFMVQSCCGLGDCMQAPNHPPKDQKKPAKEEKKKKPRAAVMHAIRNLFTRGREKEAEATSKRCSVHQAFERPKSKGWTGVPPRIMYPKGDAVSQPYIMRKGRVTIPTRRPRLNITEFPNVVKWPALNCPDYGSWRVLRKYTKPSTVTNSVSPRIHRSAAGGSLSISVTRSDTWTVNLSKEVKLYGFGGVSLRADRTCNIADSEGLSISLEPHASGHMGFTAIHHCELGTFTCEGRLQEPQEICYPFRENKRMAGVYHLITGD